ncbi:DUF2304 family protein [[Eubacterium] cellulosolvens]
MSVNVIPYGVIVAIIAASFFIITLNQYFRGRIKFRQLIFWEVLWVVLFITGIFPEIYESITVILGLATPLNLFTTSSIIFLFAFTFILYQKINEVDKKIEKIVQHLAITEGKKRKKG